MYWIDRTCRMLAASVLVTACISLMGSPAYAQCEVTLDDSFGNFFCWDGTKIDGAVGPGGADGVTQPPLVCPSDGLLDVDLIGTTDAYPFGRSLGAVCKSPSGGASAVQVDGINGAPDGCTLLSDSFTYDGTPSGGLFFTGTWTSYCAGVPFMSGTWDGTFDPSGLTMPLFNGPIKPWMGRTAVAEARAATAQAAPATLRAPHALKGLSALDVPTAFGLEQNYPNPFNPSTVIRFSMPTASPVTLRVYNTLGQVVATLVNGPMEAGHHQVAFDALGLSAGTYLYVLEAESFAATKQFTLLK